MSGLGGSGTEKTSKFSHEQTNGKLKYLNLYDLALHAHVWCDVMFDIFLLRPFFLPNCSIGVVRRASI